MQAVRLPEQAPENSPQARPQRLTKALAARPLEPILIPKLRIYFADFPYLHYSIN